MEGIIAKINDDGSVKLIRVNRNGNPDYTGKLLTQYYTKPEKIDKLLKLGDIDLLGKSIGKNNSARNLEGDDTIAFYRDLGEPYSIHKPLKVDDITTLINSIREEPYIYIYDSQLQWIFYDVLSDEFKLLKTGELLFLYKGLFFIQGLDNILSRLNTLIKTPIKSLDNQKVIIKKGNKVLYLIYLKDFQKLIFTCVDLKNETKQIYILLVRDDTVFPVYATGEYTDEIFNGFQYEKFKEKVKTDIAECLNKVNGGVATIDEV